MPHYFINSHSITDKVSAATFESYALDRAEMLFSNKDVIIMAGGTGLYIKAFCEGLDDIPEADPKLRAEIIQNYKNNGIEWLQQAVKEADPAYFSEGETENPNRLMRALEVISTTGRSVTDFRSGKVKKRAFRIIKAGLEISRDTLYTRINKRVDQMIESGLINEARNLFEHRHLNALQTVGYKELFAHFESDLTINDAIQLIKQNTRNYAKRQLTWFKRDNSINWVNAENDPVTSIIKISN